MEEEVVLGTENGKLIDTRIKPRWWRLRTDSSGSWRWQTYKCIKTRHREGEQSVMHQLDRMHVLNIHRLQGSLILTFSLDCLKITVLLCLVHVCRKPTCCQLQIFYPFSLQCQQYFALMLSWKTFVTISIHPEQWYPHSVLWKPGGAGSTFPLHWNWQI